MQLEEREIDLLARGPHLRETLGIPVAAEQFEAIGEVVTLRFFNRQLLEGPVVIEREDRNDRLLP